MEEEIEKMKTTIISKLNEIGVIKTKSMEKKLDIHDSIRDCIDILDRIMSFIEDEENDEETFDEIKADYIDTIRFINKTLS